MSLHSGFLGIGLMGAPKARNILKSGFSVNDWKRSRAKAKALVADGATVAGTPADAVRDADIVVVMLEKGPIVMDVMFTQGAAAAMQPGTLVVAMSSIGIAGSASQPLRHRCHDNTNLPGRFSRCADSVR